jgi:hypothetical protein
MKACSVFWDRKYGVWRAAEDDPGLALYAEGRDVDPMIGYIPTPLLDVPWIAGTSRPTQPIRPVT